VALRDGEDLQLRRVLLRISSAQCGCVRRSRARHEIVRVNSTEIDLSGRVTLKRGQSASIRLVLFGDTAAQTLEGVSDSKGRFHFGLAEPGDIRLLVAVDSHLGDVAVPETQVDLGWIETGSRVTVRKLGPKPLGPGWCY